MNGVEEAGVSQDFYVEVVNPRLALKS